MSLICDRRHEGFLWSFGFSNATGLCADILVEIIRYLTLEETITAFSIGILPLFRHEQIKVHLVDPSRLFLQIIFQHLDQRQLSSVRFHGILVESRHDFSAFHAFDQLISLILLNPQRLSALREMLTCLPTVRAVSLWFDVEFQFRFLADTFYSPFTGATRLQGRCAGAFGDQCISEETSSRYTRNTTIQSFIFDSGHYPLRSNRYCSHNPRSCFLRSAGDSGVTRISSWGGLSPGNFQKTLKETTNSFFSFELKIELKLVRRDRTESLKIDIHRFKILESCLLSC